MFYFHEIDRYRIIEKVIRDARKSKVLGQIDLARTARVSQGVVSNAENLSRSADLPEYTEKEHQLVQKSRVGREQLIKLLSWGLRLPFKTIHAIMWLYDGSPLQDDEIFHYVKGYSPDAKTLDGNFKAELWSETLRLVEQTLHHLRQGGRSHSATVDFFSADLDSTLEGKQKLLELEILAGQQLWATMFPPWWTMPEDIVQSKDLYNQWYPEASQSFLERYREITLVRYANFQKKINIYGARCILSKPGVQAYSSKIPGYPLPLHYDLRKKHIENTIRLLSANHFRGKLSIALINAVPELEMDLKGCEAVMIGGRQDEIVPSWGPKWIYFTDEVTTLECLLHFEKQWDEIEEHDKNCDSQSDNGIIQQLIAMLELGKG